MSGNHLLQVRNIRKSFGAVKALRGVSMDVDCGEIHALLGENGAGKSTLIRIISGAHSPDDGVVTLNGQEIRHYSPREAHALGVAVIYQQPALFPDLTVAENFALTLEPLRATGLVNRRQRRERAAGLLARVGARIDPDIEVSTLTMPEQQLVEIARALGAGAKLIILDEPTSSLSVRETDLLFEVLRELKRQGTACIYISHRLDEIGRIADRITVLRDGASVGTFAASELQPQDIIRLMVGREMDRLFPTPTRTPGPVLVEARNISSVVEGVREISFEIRAGEILGLSGLIGAGRTELARVLFGLSPSDSGSLHIDGREVRISSPQEAIAMGIGYVPEDRRRHGVIPEMAVAANITMASLLRIFPRSWIETSVETTSAEHWIRQLSIKTAGPQAAVGSLSGGNQQKVAVGRWMMIEPRFLIVDEPTQGVDVGAKAEIHRILRELADSGMAVLLISSDLPEVLGMSDRIGVMRQGRMVRTFQRHEATPQNVMAAALPETAAP